MRIYCCEVLARRQRTENSLPRCNYLPEVKEINALANSYLT